MRVACGVKARFAALRPSRLLVSSFVGAALIGALLLRLPHAVVGEPLGIVDCLFTATSAVCVTGLVVADTGSRFTPFGQGVIVGLIQLGGLGIMTLSTLLLLAIGQRLSFRERTIIRNTLSRSRDRSLVEFVRYVVGLTLTIEAFGAVILALLLGLRHGYPWHEAVGDGIFLSISAFCNAGFAPWADGLAGLRHDPLLIAVIMVLILIGGLGFVVLVNLRTRFFGDEFGERKTLTLHSRLVLTTTTVLLVLSFAIFALFEWRGALMELPPGERLLACAFQAVTPRTAGFTVVDPLLLTMPSLFLTMLLMLVGAAPGSTGGGLKITTLAILWALVRARYRGQQRVHVFNRTLPEATVSRALSTAFAGGIIILGVLFGLLITEQGGGAAAHDAFVRQLFETVSALGTVGLSLGVTDQLSTAGRLLIIGAMFAGRLGPLTLSLAVARSSLPERTRMAEEDVMVG